jgi:hypothetical protein
VLKRGRVQLILHRLVDLRETLNNSQVGKPRVNADSSTTD